jgi:hypothetical protein
VRCVKRWTRLTGAIGGTKSAILSGGFCHSGRLGARDRAYRTISPSSVTKTTGASTEKISRHTSMRSPHSWLPGIVNRSRARSAVLFAAGRAERHLSTSLVASRCSRRRLGQCLLAPRLLQVLGQDRWIDWLRLSSGGELERCGAGRCQDGEQSEQQNNLEHRASNPPCELGQSAWRISRAL